MTPAARIQAAIELLGNILDEQRPADGVVSAYFRSRRYIGSKDRAAINTRLFRIMRSYHRLNWWLERSNLPLTPRALVIADLVFGGEVNLQSLRDMFDGSKFSPDTLRPGERKLLETLEGEKLEHPDMPDLIRLECPAWAGESLKKVLGDEGFEKEMRAMMTPAPLDLRVNTLKADRDTVLNRLLQDDMKAVKGKISPVSIRLYERPPLSQHEVFKSGMVEVQDEGSQMVAHLAQAKPGEQVVDFCSGAGGKALAMAATMDNKGRIVAADVLARRLQRAKLRFRRAGAHNVETRALTSERDKWVKRHQKQFDLVLVDAPCSGTGTWRRDPDKRWRMLGPGLSELVPLQKSILESAARLVKPGGRLVYATCSLLPEENEEQVQAFLSQHSDFTLQPARDVLPETDAADDYLKMLPSAHDTDGFFAAAMVRKKETKEG